MENQTVWRLHELGLLPERLIGHEDFLDNLQDIHDHVEPENWQDKLKEFAEENNLQMPEGF